MLQIYARTFLYAVEELQNVRYGLMPVYRKEGSPEGLTEALAAQLKTALEYLLKWCPTVDLDGTKHLAEELLLEVKPGMNTDELDAKIDSIQSIARNELKKKKFLYVSEELAEYYDK